jgi:hypothetical protein
MPNVNLTHQVVAREAAAILEEEASFLMNVNRGRQDEFGEAIGGYKKGDTVRIKIPPVGRVFDGAQFANGGAATDSIERFVNLTVDTQKHIGLEFGAKEKTMEITDFRERYLRPQIRTLSSVVEADLLARAVMATPNLVGTNGTVPTAMRTYAQARARLEGYLAPPGNRACLFSSDANTELVDTSRVLFHAKDQVEQGFLQGTLGQAQGAMFYEHQSIPVHVGGTQTAAMAINGVMTEGTSTIAIDGGTGTNTITAGTVLTIAGVFAVHPLTGAATNRLQQFVVRNTVTLAAGAAAAVSIFPPLKASAPNKVVSALPADNAVVTFQASGNRQNLMFHKDAFTVATAPLPVLASCEGYTARMPSGISVRVMTFGDGNNDLERTRIDVLYGMAAVQPLHAVRITE